MARECRITILGSVVGSNDGDGAGDVLKITAVRDTDEAVLVKVYEIVQSGEAQAGNVAVAVQGSAPFIPSEIAQELGGMINNHQGYLRAPDWYVLGIDWTGSEYITVTRHLGFEVTMEVMQGTGIDIDCGGVPRKRRGHKRGILRGVLQ